MRTYSSGLKITAVVTLAFFLWSFGPLFQLPAAWAEKGGHKSASKGPSAEGRKSQRQRLEERFQAALDEIREKVGQVAAKADRGEDDTAEMNAIRAKKAEIDGLAEEIRAELASTEKTLKDKGLPKEILDRHYRFAKHFEENIRTLKTNLDDVEAAKTKVDRKAKIEKVRLRLEETKPKKHVQPLDPNNLPHQNQKLKVKPREPRTKEQFEKDFPPQQSKGKQKVADSHLLPDLIASRPQHKPVLLAFNETASDVPFPLGVQSVTPQFTLNDSSPLLLAQATTDLPTADDLAETVEVQFTDAIRAKAQDLACSPVKVYEYVRNNIEFIPTYGSIQGADMCLQTKQCNSFDTGSLLISMLRSCNIPARLNIGTIEIPIEKLTNWAGGFSDPISALNFVASGGIPITGLRSGGEIYAARMEHVWIKAFVDYIPSFGAVHKEGDTWIPLDASFKQYSYTDGVDFQTVVPFDGQSLANQIKATATINEQESYVTNVDSTLIQTALNDYNAQLDNYVTQNIPNATPGDILGKKEIIKKEQPILPASLPYKVIVTGVETSEIPDSLRHKITIQLVDTDSLSTVFSYTTSLPQLVGKRFTLSYDPATTADQDTINRYVEDYATSIPAYLIQFKPVLKLENVVVATGAPVGMGSAQDLHISLISPRGTEIVTHNLLAGDYTAIGINPSTVSLNVLQNRIDKNDFSEPVGEMLHQTALSYWAEADAFNSVIAKTLRVNNLRHPSELAASAKVSVSYVWGVPSSATYNRRNIDVKFDNQTVFSKRVDKTKEFNYMQQSGTNSSFLEGAILDQLYGGIVGDSISAITALQFASEQGIPIFTIDSISSSAILPKLQLTESIKSEIINSTNAGLIVQIPQKNISHSGWSGVGYIVLNPSDGSGAYRISGGFNGGDNNVGFASVVPIPRIPAVGLSAFLSDMMAHNMGLQLKAAGGAIVGISIPVPYPIPIPNPWVLVALALLALLIVIAKSISDVSRTRPQENWVTMRHYTNVDSLGLILTPIMFTEAGPIYNLIGSEGGECPVNIPGPYLTDNLFIVPNTVENREAIAYALGIPAPPPNQNSALVTAYVDIEVNTTVYPNYIAEFNVCTIRGARQLHHIGPLYFGEIGSQFYYRLKSSYPSR